jgi:hypothetical protein
LRTANSVTLSWNETPDDGGAPVDCYVITYHHNNNFNLNDQNVKRICATDRLDNSFSIRRTTINNLDGNQLYTFSIYAENLAGRSGVTNTLCLACVTPPTPINLREARE